MPLGIQGCSSLSKGGWVDIFSHTSSVFLVVKPGKSVYFFVVWSFLLFGLFGCFFLLFGRGRVLFFAVWAGAQAPPKRQKK